MIESEFVVRFVRRGPSKRRTAHARRWDSPNGWFRIGVMAAEKMLRSGSATLEEK